MNNQKTGATLKGVVAVYLLFAAYRIYEGRMDPGNNVPPFVMILLAVLFALAAVWLLVYAWKGWQRADREERENRPPEENDDRK